MKEKLKSYEFWVSVASAIMVFLQTLSLKIDMPYITQATMGFLGALTVAGILKKSGAVIGTNDGSDIKDTQDKKEDNAKQDAVEDSKSNKKDG